MVLVNLFGPLDATMGSELFGEGVLLIEAVLLVLVVVNFLTRKLAHNRHVAQAEDGAEAVSRFVPHELSNVVLLFGSMYYMTLAHHGGMVLSILVLGLFITDFFEFESRKVEARRDIALERPKGSFVAAALVLLYAAYQTLFFVVAPIWTAVV